MRRFEGKAAVVTGASSGIGLAVGSRLAAEGARVIAVARNAERLQSAVESWADSSLHIPLAFDASDERAVTDAFAALRRSKTVLDVAVLCAGRHAMRPLQALNSSCFDELLSANLKSALYCTKAFARSTGENGGSVVWLASAAAFIAGPGESIYAAAKGALVSACRGLACELAGRGIRVNVIAPGVVNTPMSAAWLNTLPDDDRSRIRQRHLLGFGEPEEVSGPIAFLASDDARWITGTCLTVDGGLTCH